MSNSCVDHFHNFIASNGTKSWVYFSNTHIFLCYCTLFYTWARHLHYRTPLVFEKITSVVRVACGYHLIVRFHTLVEYLYTVINQTVNTYELYCSKDTIVICMLFPITWTLFVVPGTRFITQYPSILSRY